MKKFNKCLWLTPINENDKWYSYTNGFEPHLTLGYDLNEDEIEEKINSIRDKQIEILLDDEMIESCEDGFYALYFNIKKDSLKEWMLPDSHISFLYKYSPITKEEKEELKNKITIKKCIFGKIKVKICNGDFKDW